MQTSGGMEFWINDKGRVRLFIIAETDKNRAQKLLHQKLPDFAFTTWQPVPSGVTTMLKMNAGDIVEWSSYRYLT